MLRPPQVSKENLKYPSSYSHSAATSHTHTSSHTPTTRRTHGVLRLPTKKRKSRFPFSQLYSNPLNKPGDGNSDSDDDGNEYEPSVFYFADTIMKSTSTTTASTYNSKNSRSSTKSIIDLGTQPDIVEIAQFETPMDARESSTRSASDRVREYISARSTRTVQTATADNTTATTAKSTSTVPPFFYAAKKSQACNPPRQSNVAPIQTIVPKPAPAPPVPVPVPVYKAFNPLPDISSLEKERSIKYSYLDALSQTSTNDNDEPIANKSSASIDYLSAMSSSSVTCISRAIQSEEIDAASDAGNENSSMKEFHGDVHHNDSDNPASTTTTTINEINDIGMNIDIGMDIGMPIEEQLANLSSEEAAKLVSEFMANSQQETMKELQALEDAMNAEIEALRRELDGNSVADADMAAAAAAVADAMRQEEKERDTTMPASTNAALPIEDGEEAGLERMMADVSGMSAEDLMLQIEEIKMKELQALEDAMNAEIEALKTESDGNYVADADALRVEEKRKDTAMPASTDVALPIDDVEEVDLERLMADVSGMSAEDLMLQIEEYEKTIDNIMKVEGLELSEGGLVGEASTGADTSVSVEGSTVESGNPRECEEMGIGEGDGNDLSLEDDASVIRNILVVENDIKHDATIHDYKSRSDDLTLGEDDDSDASRNGNLITSEDALLGEVGEHDILQEDITSEEVSVDEIQEEEASVHVDRKGSNDVVTSSVPTPPITSIPIFEIIPSISNDEVIAQVSSLSAEEAANAVSNYMVKSDKEKDYALKRLEKQKNREIKSLKQQIILTSSLRPGQDYEYYVESLTKRVDLLQVFMARYILEAQEEKRKAVREAEAYMEEKYSVIFNSFFSESCWDLDVGIGQDNGIFQESNAKIVADEVGPSSEESNAENVNEDSVIFEEMAMLVKEAAEEEKQARDSLQAEQTASALYEVARIAELEYLFEEARIAKETKVLEAEILAEEAEIKKLVEIAQLEEDAKLEESLEGLRIEEEKMAAEEAESLSVGSEHVTIEQGDMQEMAKENELAAEAEHLRMKDKERTRERNQREMLQTRFRLQNLDSRKKRAKVIESNQRSLLISHLRFERLVAEKNESMRIEAKEREVAIFQRLVAEKNESMRIEAEEREVARFQAEEIERLRMGAEELDRDRLQAEENEHLRTEDEESLAVEASAVASIGYLVGNVVAKRNLYRFSPTQSPIQSPFTIERRQYFTVQQDQSMEPIGGQNFVFRGFVEELDEGEEEEPIFKADATRNFAAVGPALYSVNGLADGGASQDSNCALALYSMANPDTFEGQGMQLGSGSGVAGILSVVGAGLTAKFSGMKERQRNEGWKPSDEKGNTPVPENLSKILLTESQGIMLDKCVQNLRASAFPPIKIELGLLDWEQNIPMSMGDMFDFIVGCDCAFGLPSVTPLARTVALALKSSPCDKAEQSTQQIRGKFLHIGPGNKESYFDLKNGLVNLYKMVSSMEEIVLERLELVPLVFDSLDEAGAQLKNETDANVGGIVEFQNIESSTYSALIAHHNEDYDGSNGDDIFE